MTIHDIFNEEIIIPSKMNDLTLRELDFLYPDVDDIPVFPKGIIERRQGYYQARKGIKGEKQVSIIQTRDFQKALIAYVDFCDKNKIKP